MARHLRGHSLIEVLFAAAVVGIVVMGVLNLLPYTTLALEQARQQAHAEDVARAALEAARSRPFTSLEVGTTSTLASVTLDGITYDGQLEVYAVPGEDVQHLAGVRVTVSWMRRGVVHRVSHHAWIADVPR